MREGDWERGFISLAGSVQWMARRAARLLLVLLLAGCSTTGKEKPRVELPVHYVHKDDFDITWRELRDGSDIVFYGVFRNTSDLFLTNLTMKVDLIDQEGNLVQSESYPDFPMIVPRHDTAPFSLRFPCPIERDGERVFIQLKYSLANALGPDYGLYQTVCSLDENRSR